jgi:hypothetical protein
MSIRDRLVETEGPSSQVDQDSNAAASEPEVKDKETTR